MRCPPATTLFGHPYLPPLLPHSIKDFDHALERRHIRLIFDACEEALDFAVSLSLGSIDKGAKGGLNCGAWSQPADGGGGGVDLPEALPASRGSGRDEGTWGGVAGGRRGCCTLYECWTSSFSIMVAIWNPRPFSFSADV